MKYLAIILKNKFDEIWYLRIKFYNRFIKKFVYSNIIAIF